MLPEDGWIVPAYHKEDTPPVTPETPKRPSWIDRLKALVRALKIDIELDDD